MITVVISIGSNCGPRKENVIQALEWLKTQLIQTRCSDIYETPCAKGDGFAYINAVVKGVFQGTGEELEDLLKEREHNMGRDEECRKAGKVPLDMDIVICDGAVWKEWDYRQKFFRLGYSQIENA